jgi:OOP family OmpA-OmpF porin
VNFANDSARLTPESMVILDDVAQRLNKRGDIRAEVAGHTDDRGAADYNRSLSQKRADSVRGYLVSKGVDASRLTARGYGEDSPIADNKTSQGRAENRRVELRALK